MAILFVDFFRLPSLSLKVKKDEHQRRTDHHHNILGRGIPDLSCASSFDIFLPRLNLLSLDSNSPRFLFALSCFFNSDTCLLNFLLWSRFLRFSKASIFLSSKMRRSLTFIAVCSIQSIMYACFKLVKGRFRRYLSHVRIRFHVLTEEVRWARRGYTESFQAILAYPHGLQRVVVEGDLEKKRK